MKYSPSFSALQNSPTMCECRLSIASFLCPCSSPFKIHNYGYYVDTVETVEGVCNVFLPYTRFLGFPEFSGYHQWQQESQ